MIDRLTAAGQDVQRVYVRHPGYGPEMYVRSCEYELACRAYLRAIKAADQVLAAVQGGCSE